MFNRVLQVKMVKKEQAESISTSEVNFEQKLDKIRVIAKEVTKEGSKLLVLWVLLDTVREVLVAQANK